MASPLIDTTVEPPSFDVHRLEYGSTDSDGVVMMKLTDEFSNALNLAQRGKIRIKVHIDDKGGYVDLGDAGKFYFNTQSLSGDPSDSVVHDRKRNSYKSVGAFKTKYQVQATDKSFAETREKAQKLVEEEKSRGVKDIKSRKPLSSSASRVASSSSSRHASPLLAKTESKISPNKFGDSGSLASSNNGSSRQPHPLVGDLRKKKLRQRVVQLIVTGRYNSVDEVVSDLRKDGLREDDNDVRKIEACVLDVSEKNSADGKFSLKTSLHSEVDPRWLFYNSEDKASVRRILAGNQQNISSASFAPMRKSKMERMQAPSGHSSQTVSPDAMPTPPNSRPSSGGSNHSNPIAKKTPSPPLAPPPTRVSPELTPSHDSGFDEMPVVATTKRKAHVPAQNQQPEKRIRTDVPDPMINNNIQQSNKEKLMMARHGGSNASSRNSSPCSLSSPTGPSVDYEKKYPEIKSLQDAETYFNIFHTEYPTYMKHYKRLNEVAKEFREFENQLKSRSKSDVLKVEKKIQDRFAHYDKNEDFLKARQQHAELRSKLGVLKQRITVWERHQGIA